MSVRLLIVSFAWVIVQSASALADDRSVALERQLERLSARVEELEAENAALKARLEEEEQARALALAGDQTQELSEALERRQQAEADLIVERDKLQVLAGLPPMTVSHARIVSDYQSEGDLTRVLAKPLVIPASTTGLGTSHSLGVEYRFSGRSAAAPVEEGWLVITTASNPSNRYRKLDQITLDADGQVYALTVDHYETTRVRQSGGPRSKQKRYDERLVAAVDFATLRALARASELELILGRNRFHLTPNHGALLAAIVERMRETGAR